jgi:hypothetical protein
VSTAQAAVLFIVAAQGPITQRAVARQLGLNESGMTAMTNRLSKEVGSCAAAGWLTGWQPGSKVSMTIIRPPQRGHGQGDTRASSSATFS